MALPTHSWDVTTSEARAIQEDLRARVVLRDEVGDVRFVAGVDCGFEENDTMTRAAVAVLSFPELELVDFSMVRQPTTFPYVPGFLSFREVPAVMAAMAQLQQQPDLVLCDGQGTAHPRRFGIACHLGVLTGLPCIGVAKSRLLGEWEELPGAKGSWVEMIDQGEVVGAVVRTRQDVKPLYVSVGHKLSLPTAVDFVMKCVTQYRLPETTRLADRLASRRGPLEQI